MDLRDLRDHLDARLDRLEGKLDAVAERGARNETDITWLKGHARVVTTTILAVCGFLAAAYFHLISP